MDSKPVAIIIAIVATVGAMSGAALFATNIFAGTSTAADLLPKTVEVLYVSNTHLEGNIAFTNQGSGTLKSIDGIIVIDGAEYKLTNVQSQVPPYKTLGLRGSINSGENCRQAHAPTLANFTSCGEQFTVYPGDSVLLRISVSTTNGDVFEKLYPITVK